MVDGVSLQQVWSIDAYPDLRDHAYAASPSLREFVTTMSRQLPLPLAADAFVDLPRYRPPGSHRVFYHWPAASNAEISPGDVSVVAIKGMEPAAPFIADKIEALAQPCYSPHSVAAHLVLEERKVPAAVALAEAMTEATAAASIQSAHLQRYGHLARLPLPLGVFRHRHDDEARLLGLLENQLPGRARDIVTAAIGDGLGVLIYYYPAPPVRVRDLDGLLSGLGYTERQLALLMNLRIDTEWLIDQWTTLFARMLGLGYLCGTQADYRTGICCQPQNACLDGGFVDVDSVTALDAVPDDGAVQLALEFSTQALVESVSGLLLGAHTARLGAPDINVDVHHIRSYVVARIATALQADGRTHPSIDSRVRQYFMPPGDFSELIEALKSLVPAPNHAARSAAVGFGELAVKLVRSGSRLRSTDSP